MILQFRRDAESATHYVQIGVEALSGDLTRTVNRTYIGHLVVNKYANNDGATIALSSQIVNGLFLCVERTPWPNSSEGPFGTRCRRFLALTCTEVSLSIPISIIGPVTYSVVARGKFVCCHGSLSG